MHFDNHKVLFQYYFSVFHYITGGIGKKSLVVFTDVEAMLRVTWLSVVKIVLFVFLQVANGCYFKLANVANVSGATVFLVLIVC